MNFSFSQLLEGTFAAIIIYLVLKNGDNFAKVLTAAGSTYAQGVAALQGNYAPPK